ncbi:sensor histidine kinase, partial [Pseudomonas sp. MAFF212428]|nr:sensor histidine kinase [Pseudomonas brassicae]
RRILLQAPERAAQVYPDMPATLAVAALRNLLDNALRHSAPGAPVELQVQLEAHRVAFVVRDHGPGIDPQNLEHVTQRFWRNGHSEGCGLGLAIVQAIVQRCACALQFDSRADGLRVLLQMPLRVHQV